MCYHVKQTTSMDILAAQLGVDMPKGDFDKLYQPQGHINGFGFEWMPIRADENPDRLRIAKWWLMPPWEKEWSTKAMNTLNTKVEKIDTPRSICHRFQKKHATLVVDGFYEWQHVGLTNNVNGKKEVDKIRHLIFKPNGECFQLACLYSDWYFPELDATIKTVSVLTRPANELMSHIHNTKKRMPVIFEPEMANHWLNGHVQVEDILDMDEYFEELNLMALKR